MKTANPVTMYAVINRGKKFADGNYSEWINYATIRSRRKDAWAEYVGWWDDPKTAMQHRRRGDVRLAKVIVSLA